jgi:serine/threonine protein kinase
LADDPIFRQRFRREALICERALGHLRDPHVVPIFDIDEIDGRLYVAMRLIHFRDLESILEDGPLDPARAVTIVEQVARALDGAHRIGIVHRSLKPSNIFITDYDFTYLSDFYTARAAASDDMALMRSEAMIGTWASVAPEEITPGYSVNQSSNVYSLSCVLHQSLTGQPPFPGEGFEQQVIGHLRTPPPKPSMIRAGVPAAFDVVIARGMAKNPSERYSTTIELAQAAGSAIGQRLNG